MRARKVHGHNRRRIRRARPGGWREVGGDRHARERKALVTITKNNPVSSQTFYRMCKMKIFPSVGAVASLHSPPRFLVADQSERGPPRASR